MDGCGYFYGCSVQLLVVVKYFCVVVSCCGWLFDKSGYFCVASAFYLVLLYHCGRF